MGIKEDVRTLLDRLTEEEMARVRVYLLVLLEERTVLTEAETDIAASLTRCHSENPLLRQHTSTSRSPSWQRCEIAGDDPNMAGAAGQDEEVP